MYSDQLSDVGTYTIEIFGQFGTYGTATESFTLTVINPCPTDNLVIPSTIAYQNYEIFSDYSTLVYFTNFVSGNNYTFCGSIDYTGEYYKNTDPSIISQITSWSSLPCYLKFPSVFQIETFCEDLSWAGDYTVEIIGTYNLYPSV